LTVTVSLDCFWSWDDTPFKRLDKGRDLVRYSGKVRALVRVAISMCFVIPLLYGPNASAAEGAAMIEEVVVTARKREESLQEVPVAVSAFNREEIERVFGNDIAEFSKYTPNVVLARQPYAGNALFGGIRGIVFGDLEKSFDPAVGVVVDGVPLITNTSALIDTFDLQSIEILRGPQGTLFGRNTIAGVINVRRTLPTKETGVRAQFRYGANNEQDYKIVANFGNSSTFGIKLGAFIDRSDGITKDADFNLATGEITSTGSNTDGEHTDNFIASMLWEPTEKFSALFTYENTNDKSVLSTPTNLTVPNLDEATWDGITGQMFADIIGGVIPPAAAVGNAIGGTLAAGGNFCDIYGTSLAPVNGWVRDIGCASQGYLVGEENGYKYSYAADQFINEIKKNGYTLELNWDISDQLLMTWITNYTESSEILDEDNLGAAVPIFNPVRPQDYDQTSTELRLVSSNEGWFNYLAGVYFVESEYEITQSIYLFGGRPAGLPPSPDGDAGQKLNSVALFGELYFGLSDKATLTLGGRWTQEEKEFWIYQRSSGDASGLLPPTVWGCGNLSSAQQATADATAEAWIAAAPDQATADARAAGLECNSGDGKEKWDRFTPRVVFDYRFTDALMGYASYSQGFRSGGWNGRATTPGSIGPYDPEKVDSFELGMRSDFLDNTLRVNLTGFYTDYSDKHESTIFQFGFATETVVDNAAKAEIKGLELESTWVPTDKWLFRVAAGYNKGKYKEFESFNRLTGEVEDISDEFAFGFAPEWNVNAGADFFQPIGGDMLIFRANYAWADGTVGNFGQPDPAGLDRNVFPSRTVWDFSVIWEHDWLQVSAFVKDAFHDDNYLATSVDVGVFWFGAVAPGRIWGIELTGIWE
jgi:iron complex outermembrane receptor protein